MELRPKPEQEEIKIHKTETPQEAREEEKTRRAKLAESLRLRPLPEASDSGIGTPVGNEELLLEQNVVPILDATVLYDLLTYFDELPNDQKRKETFVGLFGYYYTDDQGRSFAVVTHFLNPEKVGSATEVGMSAQDTKKLRDGADELESSGEAGTIIIGAAHTHPNLGADFFSKPDRSIHNILNRMGAKLGKIKLGEETPEKQHVPVIGIVYDPIQKEMAIYYKRYGDEDTDYQATKGIYIIGHTQADRDITKAIQILFDNTDQRGTQKISLHLT